MTRVITFLSDYGLADEYVGVVHGVIARLAPDARVIDLGHGVPRHDVRTGARRLARALPFTPAGVHLAVVDPGVGGGRRAVALRCVEEERVLVGPDNGLLLPAAERLGGVAEAVEISASRWRLEPVSATFHGRDVFAPVAARLAAGGAFAEAGVPLDVGGLVRLPAAPPGVVQVEEVDGFGNVILSRAPEALVVAGRRVKVGRTFSDVAPGELVLYEDSGGEPALAVNGGSAAALLGVRAGDELRVERA